MVVFKHRQQCGFVCEELSRLLNGQLLNKAVKVRHYTNEQIDRCFIWWYYECIATIVVFEIRRPYFTVEGSEYHMWRKEVVWDYLRHRRIIRCTDLVSYTVFCSGNDIEP